MTYAVIVYRSEEGGFWAEVPELHGCASQGETLDELKANITEAMESVLAVHLADGNMPQKSLMTWGVTVDVEATVST